MTKPADDADYAKQSRQQPELPETPKLDAWRITGSDERIVVGKWFNDPRRIEIDPDDIINDPDARGDHQ